MLSLIHILIGYAKNESEYLDAEQQAKTRLKTAASASGKEQELIKPAQYQLCLLYTSRCV